MQKKPPQYVLDLVFHPEHDQQYVHFENGADHPFQPDPAGFPRVNVWWLADSALLTYWEPVKAGEIFRAAGFDSEFVKVGSTDCYVAWRDGVVIVAFRGTEPDEWQDMLTNAKIQLVPWSAGQVHRGFKKAIDDIWPTLEPKLNALSQGRKVWFCGHSLGAALATLAADRFPGTRGVCAFASPRVGDRTFASAFNLHLAGKTLRYVNHHDVVTHVPPPLPSPLPGYKHVDVACFIATDGTISGAAPSLLHFFSELIGTPEHLLDIIENLRNGTLSAAPNFLLEHMPKAYAIFAWNDFDANG
jgi:triacylglycerol lipase